MYNQQEVFQTFPPTTQVVMLDEYSTANLTITKLNQMCDGTLQYPTKGGEPLSLEKPLILICGNASIDSVYPNKGQFLKARFIEICLDPEETPPPQVPVLLNQTPYYKTHLIYKTKNRDMIYQDISKPEVHEQRKRDHDFLTTRHQPITLKEILPDDKHQQNIELSQLS